MIERYLMYPSPTFFSSVRMRTLLGISNTIKGMNARTMATKMSMGLSFKSVGSFWIKAVPIFVLPIKEKKLRKSMGRRTWRSVFNASFRSNRRWVWASPLLWNKSGSGETGTDPLPKSFSLKTLMSFSEGVGGATLASVADSIVVCGEELE